MAMNQEPTIRVMPPELAERIAAGEVVERPASVVKELIENSLDAGARAIGVEIRAGGLALMRVNDDGCGMSRADAPLALARFATSKVHTAADLDGISTLGFRGEALSSIAAVARVEVVTRTGEELEGTRVQSPTATVDEGRPTDDGPRSVVGPPYPSASLRELETTYDVQAAASPVGTSVTVRDLFYNTPARRKFLKSPMRETELVRETVIRYALAYPGVAFRLLVDGRERLIAPPASPLERVGLCLGREVGAEMLEIAWSAGDLRLSGFISRPTIGRSRRQGQFFFMNGRPIRSGLLAVMLERPYAGRLPAGRYPLAVVHVTLDPRLVDVNVHPRKAEVRLAQERAVYQALTQAVQEALSPFPVQTEYAGWSPSGWAGWPFDGELGEVREGGAAYVVAGGVQALGQVLNTYLVARSSEGLVVVDQHAAHEQVLYERLSAAADAQPLPAPVRLSLTAREAETLRPALLTLAELGFKIEPFGGDSFLVRALPTALADQPAAEQLTVLIEELGQLRRRGADAETVREGLATRAACTAAVKAGDNLTAEQQQALLDDLMCTWSPATCPHGRPAFITLTQEELERRFLRR
jgi:DNA mismatch repair protein MutL